MRKYRQLTAIILTLLICTLFTAGCDVVLVPADDKIESGESDTRFYEMTEYTGVEIDGAFEYEIQKADNWSIKITAGSNLFEYITVTKSGKVLNINMREPDGIFLISYSHPRPRAIITMPELASLDSSGATDGSVIGFKSEDDINISLSGACAVDLENITAVTAMIDLSGASKVTGRIMVDILELEVASASNIELEGSAGDVILTSRGASRANLSDFIIHNADITLRDASHGTINLDGKLDVRLSGASKLEYFGEPSIGILDVSGASTFKKK
ncbi:GIN domain-containing protein [Chloroflexota bacterium]